MVHTSSMPPMVVENMVDKLVHFTILALKAWIYGMDD